MQHNIEFSVTIYSKATTVLCTRAKKGY